MYVVAFSRHTKKALKQLRKSGNFNEEKFEKLLLLLKADIEIPASYKLHTLKGSLVGQFECHLAYDLLVLYKRNETSFKITIINIGTHNQLFGR